MQGLEKAEVQVLRSHLNDLSRDNAILKRAVAIQNNRMQVGLLLSSCVSLSEQRLSCTLLSEHGFLTYVERLYCVKLTGEPCDNT